MAAHRIGSIWSVLGLEDSAAVILAGPFAAARGAPEYLVAPLYSGREAGFVWTSEDVKLEPEETGLGEVRFAAIWNARPVLAADLLFEIGNLGEEATIAVRDVYWASLNEQPLASNPRLGREIQSTKDPAAQFQAGELEKWQTVSGRVFDPTADFSASVRFSMGEMWDLSHTDVEELSAAMEQTDNLLGRIVLDGVGATMAWFTMPVNVLVATGGVVDSQPDLFESVPGQNMVWYGQVNGISIQWDNQSSIKLREVAVNSELSLAA